MKTEASPPPPTVEHALGWATERLTAGGVDRARREALGMWSAVAGVDPAWVVSGAERPMTVSDWESFRVAVDCRARGAPRAYATRSAGFRTLDLEVDQRVLIPRPETEGLVQRVLDWAATEGKTGALADVGTGSGCIALSLAVEGPFGRVLATDASGDALEVAANNLARVGPSCPVELRLGEFLEPLGSERFDAVVSNPPYVSDREFDGLEPGVRDFEPRSALVSGDGGMEHIRILLQNAARYLTEGGLLALEVDATRAADALAMAVRCGWSSPRIERDVFDRERYLLATRPVESTGMPSR